MSMESRVSPSMKSSLLIVSSILLALGGCGGPLISRLYFIHGGKCLWFATFLQNIGFLSTPILLVIAFFRRRGATESKLFYMNLRLFLAATVIGFIGGLDGYLYANGFAHLPISTSTLISSSQLAFMAVFAFLLVKQKFTAFSINAVLLLTVGAGVLALHTSSDRPEGESKKDYIKGFVLTIVAAALYGFMYPLVELIYMKANQCITFTVVLEFQTIIGLFSTILCIVGMIVNNDFKVIPREAREFGLGETKYYVVVVFTAIIWQCLNLGALGVIFCASSLLSGIIMAVLLSVTEVLAVIFYKEKFQAEKGVALVLSLWGFASYFYGEFQQSKRGQKKMDDIIPEIDQV